jgi:2-methylcitrate dehydratase PrpD
MQIEEVAKSIAQFTWAQLPVAVKLQAKHALLDTLGTMFGGRSTAAAVIAARAAHAEVSDGVAWVCATNGRSTRELAAFANAVSANILDMDDGHYLGGAIHPGAPIISALLAASAGRRVSGSDFLVAQVAGYEVAIRLGYLLWPTEPSVRNHTSGTSTAVGAAAAAAHLLRLDDDGIRRAMQIAWGHAPMAYTQFPMVKESIGWAAATGIMAAQLAEHGFMGDRTSKPSPAVRKRRPPTPFDESPRASEEFVTNLGRRFEASETYFKQYATCRFTHAAADALVEILSENHLEPADVTRVVVGTHRWAVHLVDQCPTAVEYAQYSFPFHLGAVAVHRSGGPRVISETGLKDEAVLAFARKVSVEHHADLDHFFPARYPSRVELVTRSGVTFRLERVSALGDSDMPFTHEQLVGKFRSLTALELGSSRAEELVAVCDALETMEVSDLLDCVGAGGIAVAH